MYEQNDKLPRFIIVPIAISITVIYMSFVYRTWGDFEELVSLAPSFLITGISVGLFISLLPLKRPIRFSFLVSSVAPFLSVLSSLALNLLITSAEAGKGPINVQTQPEAFWIFFIVISLIFGFVAMFGCYIGLFTQSRIKKLYKSINNNSHVEQPSTDIKAAKIGAITTLSASILGALVSLIIAFSSK